MRRSAAAATILAALLAAAAAAPSAPAAEPKLRFTVKAEKESVALGDTIRLLCRVTSLSARAANLVRPAIGSPNRSSIASYTAPIPPWPSRRTMRYRFSNTSLVLSIFHLLRGWIGLRPAIIYEAKSK